MNLHENHHDWRGVTASMEYQIWTRYLKPFMCYSGLKSWKSSAHTHASGRQLKIIFLSVLDYSEYSDTNISISFSTKTASSVIQTKIKSTFKEL